MFNRSLGESDAFTFKSYHKGQYFFCAKELSVCWIKLRFNSISAFARKMQSKHNSLSNEEGNRSLVFKKSSFSTWSNWLAGNSICSWKNTKNSNNPFEN